MKYLSLLLINILCFSQAIASYFEHDGWLSIELQHSLDPNDPEKFTFRGNVSIPSLNIGVANPVQSSLTTEDRNNLKKLAVEDKFYRLRSIVTYSNGDEVTFLSSSKACSLVNSELTDIVWVSLDNTGSVLAVTQTVSGSGSCSSESVYLDHLEQFNTAVFVKHMEYAPVPDTTSFIQKLEREREARERGDVRDNRGFFAKYWMYIVPVVILVFISGATNPDANAGGGR